ncbi:hypothetical protein [Kitasatospora sp. NPDC059327]|uniref:hypothetical protein n=1 Tax=Kitasatospora sp. NPDC059327 TaxID=3346803 RepID=UPI0036B23F36
MTDRLPRRSGGDGDGPDDTPMERLLREALDARATRITAHDLRPAAPPSRRARRLRPAHLAAVPLLGLAAALAFGVLGFRGDTVAGERDPGPAATVTATASPSAGPTAEPTPSESPTAAAASPTDGPTGAETEAPLGVPDPPPVSTSATTPATTPPATPPSAATTYAFRGVKFKVPAGWKVLPPTGTDSSVCVLSPGAPTTPQTNWTPGSCEPYGVRVSVYIASGEIEGGMWPLAWDLDAPAGFGHQPNCPMWGRPYFPADGYTSVGAPVKTKETVAGGRAIDKTQWQVSCTATDSFTAQLWGMKDDQVFVAANGLKADYLPGLASIIGSLDVSGHKNSIPVAKSNTVALTVDGGLGAGQEVPNDGTPVEFAVTFRNTSRTGYASVMPTVYVMKYPGSPVSDAFGGAEGVLERQEGSTWKQLDLATLEGTSKSLNSGAAFPLAPGQSKVVRYRLRLTPRDGAGALPLHLSALQLDAPEPFPALGEKYLTHPVVAK